MGFLSKFIAGKVENAFDRIQSEAMQERLKEQDKKASKAMSLFPIQELFNFGPMANITAISKGPQAAARAEVQNVFESTFAPLLSDLYAFTGGVRNLFEPFYYENRFGGYLGGQIGAAAGFILGFILPGGPLVWSSIFGFLGEHLGTFVQGGLFGPREHPDVPGLPNYLQGDTTPDDFTGGVYIPHDFDFPTQPATPYISTPTAPRGIPPLRTLQSKLRGHMV